MNDAFGMGKPDGIADFQKVLKSLVEVVAFVDGLVLRVQIFRFFQQFF